MTDKELLEVAARAAGIDGPHQVDICGAWVFHSPRKKNWNPLTDDGDALRLAVKLDIWIHPGEGPEVVEVVGLAAVRLAADADRNAATRRAIVRAAAAIGEQA